MKFPWTKRDETRQQAGYTEALYQLLLQQVTGNTGAKPTAVGALEMCAGQTGRGFAGAEVSAASDTVVDALSPDILELIGRSYIRAGELVVYIDTEYGLDLLPCSAHTVHGGPNPNTWTYDVTVSGPTTQRDYQGLSAGEVLHFRYATDNIERWRGYSPLDVALLAGKLSAETVNALADESSGPIGRIIGTPVDGDDPTITNLKAEIVKSKGKISFLETGDWGNIGNGVVDLRPHRFGAEPPQSLVLLHKDASREVMAACGFNPSLFLDADAASLREAWRLALFGTLAPLGKKAVKELRMKLDPSIVLTWEELRASDLQGRARAFQSMVGGGMDVTRAIELAGLMVED